MSEVALSEVLVGKIIQADNKDIVDQRNRILNHQLRSFESSPNIVAEYPIVLAKSSLSYCLVTDQGEVVCHANLWPRRLKPSGLELGFIGNVATAHNYKNQGYMQKFLKTLMDQHSFDAYVLWSEIASFFAKLDFKPFGDEYRVSICSVKIKQSIPLARFLVPPFDLAVLNRLLQIQHPGAFEEVVRSKNEFETLLKIPNTFCSYFEDDEGPSYAICGKGADMQGIVHEWRASSIKGLQEVIGLFARSFAELVVLSPQSTLAMLDNAFDTKAIQQHPIGLAHCKSQYAQDVLQKCFIWGMDSI
jgi:hypothetical protein